MQSRRRFFCARVELVQLARAFSLSRHSRPQATPGRWTERKSHSPGTAAHRWTQPPQRAHRATQPGKGTGTQASPETGHRAAHSGAQSRPQRASRRGYRNAGEGKPTATTAPAQHPGRKSGRFSVIFRAIFCRFSRLCPALPVSFIVGKSKVGS